MSLLIVVCLNQVDVAIVGFSTNSRLSPVDQRLDNALLWINHYPVDSAICFVNIYPLDRDLSGGQFYPAFKQLVPVL